MIGNGETMGHVNMLRLIGCHFQTRQKKLKLKGRFSGELRTS